MALTQQEEHIVNKIRKAKLFVFLRRHRHELFDEAFQEEVASLYRKETRGQPPVAPAILALSLILEAYTGVSDDEVIEATVMDRRWQLVLDCLDCEHAPFSKGTFVAFRQRLIEAQAARDDADLEHRQAKREELNEKLSRALLTLRHLDDQLDTCERRHARAHAAP